MLILLAPVRNKLPQYYDLLHTMHKFCVHSNRYLFALQIKQDLATGRLVCNMNTTAMLSAYIAQGELGDYSEEDMPDHTYLKCISFVPNQSDELEQGIMQYHRGFGYV